MFFKKSLILDHYYYKKNDEGNVDQLSLSVTLKFVCFWGGAPDLAGGTYDAPPDSLVDWGGRPCPDPSHSAPRLSRSAEGAYIISLKTQPPPPPTFLS